MSSWQSPMRSAGPSNTIGVGQPAAASESARPGVSLQIDAEPPEISPARSLNGWHREFCVELLGDGAARVFVRAVQQSSLKAAELQRAILFHRLDPRFADLAGCVEALRPKLEALAATAKRALPSKENLFITVGYDRGAWDRVEQAVDRWARR